MDGSVMMDVIINNIIALVGMITGGGILFYRQNKIGKKIDNESRLSEEWRKLYDNSRKEEQVKENEINMLTDKITGLCNELTDTRGRVSKLELAADLNKIYICKTKNCEKRDPPSGF